MKVWFNGAMLPIEGASVSVLDHGFLYGDGVFETLRAYDGVVFELEGHLRRLYRSLSLIRLDIGIEQEALAEAIYATLHENSLVEAYIRVTVTRGVGEPGLDPALCSAPTVLVMARPFKPHLEGSIKAAIVKTRRNLSSAIDPRIKSLNFLNNIIARIEAKDALAQEALMLNYRGHISECTVSNIFFVRDEALYTPSLSCGILDGITRGLVLQLARQEGITTREGEYFPATLYRASEVFVTNTSMEVMPVHGIDDIAYPIGSVTTRLSDSFAAYRDAYVKRKGRKERGGSAPLQNPLQGDQSP
ncbi:MAG: aminotransferase class IV [Nitrospirae bacterium]|nr:aminotransferase class IV [Nitrospirota bacterium]